MIDMIVLHCDDPKLARWLGVLESEVTGPVTSSIPLDDGQFFYVVTDGYFWPRHYWPLDRELLSLKL